MAEHSRAGYLHSFFHPIARGLLIRTGLEDLSLRSPRLWPDRSIFHPAPPLAQALRPYRRRIWRQRSGCVLVRLTSIGLAALLLFNLAALAWGLALPVSLRLLPLILCLAGGVWLAIAQRPTSIEVAQLLDRRYRLREALTTAVELSTGDADGPLHAPQIAMAQVQIQQLSHHTWSIPRRGERSMLIALLVAAVTTLLLAPTTTHPALQASTPSTGTHSSTHAPALAAQALPARRSLAFPAMHSSQQPTSPAASTHHVPTLAMSLQVRIGPQVAMTGSDSAPGFLSGAAGGSGAGISGGQRSGGAGPRGDVQSHNGNAPGTSSSGQAGQGGTASSQGQGGQQGSDQNGGQGPQSGPQGNPGQASGPQGATGNGQDPTTGLQPSGQSSQRPPQGQTAGGSGQAGANPFGQDQPNGTTHNPSGNAGAQGGSRQGRGHGAGTPNSKPSSGATNGHSPSGDSSLSANNQDETLRRQHGSSQSQADTHAPNRPGQAGPASGQQVNLGGRFVLGNGVGSPQLVRVLPLGAAPGAGMDGSTTVGSPIVQGYVPEDATSLGPDEQALVRAYFSGGSN